jgi:hypothetical protein
MKATALLKRQHQDIDRLFKRIEKTDGAEQVAHFERLAATLVAHDAIERELFYPACAKALSANDTKEILGEAVIEHGVLEFCLYLADRHRNARSFAEHVMVLKEFVQHHVDEEEKELLPKVDKALQNGRLNALGDEMRERFDEVVAGDYRRALRTSLRRVLGRRTTQPTALPASARRNAMRAS